MAPIAELTKNEHKCDYCGYDERYVVGSHVEYAFYGYDRGIERRCEYMDARYNITHDDNGDFIVDEK